MGRNEIIVQQLDGEAWERGEITIVGRPATLTEWCGKLIEWEMRLAVMPLSRITGGPYDGGHVLMAIRSPTLAFGPRSCGTSAAHPTVKPCRDNQCPRPLFLGKRHPLPLSAFPPTTPAALGEGRMALNLP